MSSPKCPECHVAGISNIVSQRSTQESKTGNAWFEVAYCKSCGHIYGVFPKYLAGCGAPSTEFFAKMVAIIKGVDPDELDKKSRWLP
jgi:hypothetical protein